VVLGAVGLIWAAAWYFWYRDEPKHHRAVNQVEIDIIGAPAAEATGIAVPWIELLRSGNLRAILAMYFTFGYTGYIYITWLPSYLREARHLSVEMTAVFASLPAILGMISKPLGGWWSDRACARRGLQFGRRLVGIVGFGLGAAAVLPAVLTSNPYGSALLLALADGAAGLAHGVCFAVCLDVGVKRSGTMSALMLTAGSLGNALSALAFGAFLQWTESWTYPFALAMVMNFAGALLWMKIDPTEQIL